MRDWTLLNNQKRIIVNDILNKWESMLNDEMLSENDYQQFLVDHAGIFFSSPGSHIVLTKPDLGGEYVPDLVVLYDNESFGFVYRFIELESPHDKVFTSRGTQAVALTNALQQVEDWKRWLSKNQQSGYELFPSKGYKLTGDPQVRFSVIIGRRESVKDHEAIRMQKSLAYNCDIRTFDYFSDLVRKKTFLSELFAESDSSVTEEEKNELVSPFFKAMSSGQWRSLRKHNPFYASHSMGMNAKAILKYRSMNNDLLEQFDNLDS
jgi:hypothetical protein